MSGLDERQPSGSGADYSFLHDGRVLGIRLVEGVAQIEIKTVKDQPYDLTLHGLSRLRAMEFREGNIILDVRIVPGGCITGNLIAELLGCESGDECIEPVLELCAREHLKMVVISPSYGCSLVATCIDVAVVPRSPGPKSHG